jgi:hypothetical protein
MTPLAAPARPVYSMGTQKTKAGIRIQKPEIQSYKDFSPVSEPLEIKPIWKLLVTLTYLFSFIGLFFAFSA